MAISAAVVDLLSTFLLRFYVPSKLRITPDSIEEVDGPVIRQDSIVAVRERDDGNRAGLEIVGAREHGWLPKYNIFVPAALPQYVEIRKLVLSWKSFQN